MAKICTNEKTAARQQWIEDGLLELMQERKFESIAVSDLCRHIDLSRRSFYRYFNNIEDVLDSMMHHAFQDMAIQNTPFTLKELTASYEFWYHHKPLLNALIQSDMHGKIVEYTLKYTDGVTLKNYLSREDLVMDISREMILFVVTGLSSLLISWHSENFQKTPEQMGRIAYRLLYAPILPSK